MKLKGLIQTYSSWLLSCIFWDDFRSNFILKTANFTASGVEAVIIDRKDQQLYHITVEPFYETEEQAGDKELTL
jgi:hypothetical protein